MTEHELLVAEDVQARYRLADVRSARALMHRIGAFRLAGRLYLRREDLVAFEDSLRQPAAPPAPPPVPIAQARKRQPAGPSSDLPPYWWRTTNEKECA